MTNLNVSLPADGVSGSNFESARALAFSLAESSHFDSYEHFGSGPFVNIRDAQGDEMICRVGGRDCAPLTSGPANSPDSLQADYRSRQIG